MVQQFIKRNSQGILWGAVAGAVTAFLFQVASTGEQALVVLIGIILGILLQALQRSGNARFLKNRLLFILSTIFLIIIAAQVFFPGTLFSVAIVGTVLGGIFGLAGKGIFGFLGINIIIPVILIIVGAIITVGLTPFTFGVSAPIGITLIIIGIIWLVIGGGIAIASIVTLISNFKLILFLGGILLALLIISGGARK